MSFVVKKKGAKIFTPRLPQKRPAAPSSTQSSARPSVERLSQTPGPHTRPIEVIAIPDGDIALELTDAPTSKAVETTPHQALHTPSEDDIASAHPTTQIAAQKISQHATNAITTPDGETLKRKTRDLNADEEGPHKRHQPSNLDAPRSPLQSTPAEKPQAIEIPSQLAQLEEHVQSSDSRLIQNQTEPIELPQSPKTTFSMNNTLGNALKIRGAVENFATTLAPTGAQSSVTVTTSRRPLPENRQRESADNHDGSEFAIISLRESGAVPGLGAAGDIGSSAGGGRLAQTPVIVPMASLNPDGSPGEPHLQAAAGTKKKKVPKRRMVQRDEEGDDVRATVEMILNKPPRNIGKKAARKKKDGDKRKDKRAGTPEGAEEEKIDREAIKMSELTKDLRMGKKFSRHDELRQREKQNLMKAKLAKTRPDLALLNEGAEEVDAGEVSGQAVAEGEAREETVAVGDEAGGPQMRIVRGQIVVDENSMQIDRQKIARALQKDIEVVEENDFTRATTSGTYMKRERAQLWDTPSNEIFWKGLRMFGTDFEMISKMFPNRNRRQIKLKFNKEEKNNPVKVDRILKGIGNAIELDTYEELSGLKLEEVADIEAERERIEAEQKAEEDRRLFEHAESERKKKEAISSKSTATNAARILETADVDDGDESAINGDSAEKENQPTGKELRKGNSKDYSQGEKSKEKGSKKKPRRKKALADETVQVLGDA